MKIRSRKQVAISVLSVLLLILSSFAAYPVYAAVGFALSPITGPVGTSVTATISGNGAGSGTGSIFWDGSALSPTVTITCKNGVATFTVPSSTPGSHTVTANGCSGVPSASFRIVEVSTSLSTTTIDAGQSVTDSATLSGASSTAGGTVQYEFFNSGTCTGSPTNVGGTVTVTNGVVPNSQSQIFSTAGSYGWKAVYSGDTNNNGATSACEPLTVNPAVSGVTLGPFAANPVLVSHPDNVQVSWSGGTTAYTVTLFFGTSSTCSLDTNTAATASNVASSPTTIFFTSPASPGTYFYCAMVTDSKGGSASSATSTLTVSNTVPEFPLGLTLLVLPVVVMFYLLRRR